MHNLHMTAFAFSGLLIFFSSTAMALLVFFQNNKPAANKIWCIFCLTVAVWGIGVFLFASTRNPEQALIYWKYAYLGAIFIPSIFHHFVILFLELKKKYVPLFYGISIFFACFLPTQYLFTGVRWAFNDYYNTISYMPFYCWYVLFFVATVIVSHYHLLKFLRETSSVNRREQLKWFFAATAVGFTGGMTCFLPNFYISLYPYGNFAVVLYPLIMSYAILKHQLMDLRIVVQKTFFYTFWTLALSVFYAMSIVIMQALLSGSDYPSLENWKTVEAFIYRWSGAVSLLVNLAFAVFVWTRNSKSVLCRKFSWLSICIGFWAAGSWCVNIIPDQNIALITMRLNYAFGVFVPVLFLDFVSALAEKKMPRSFIRGGYVVSFLFAVSALSSSRFITGFQIIQPYDYLAVAPGFIHHLFVVYFGLYFAAALGILANGLKRASKEKRSQLWYVFLAYFIGMSAGFEYFLSVYGVLGRPPLDDYILVLTFLILSYAITKHALLDIKSVVRKTAFYSLLAFVISTAYIFIVFVIHKFFIGDVFTQKHLLTSLVLILFITLLLRPVENFLRRRLDKRFFKGTIEEISEQKDALAIELERRERLKSVGVLAAGMAHEIKNPITAIRTFAEFLPKKYEDAQFREKFSRLLIEETDRISGIVRDLLLFARPSEPLIQGCDASEIVESITNLLRGDFIKHDIQLEKQIEKAQCLADPLQIKQALLNIIMNAVDALRDTSGPRYLKIMIAKNDKHIEISVSDNGCGIAPEMLTHLFDPFYTGKEDGTGLGLAITHSIIEKNRGKIEVHSEVKKGSTFIISLPSA